MALIDRSCFRDHGYCVVPEAVPRELAEAVATAVWEFLGMDPDDPDDWYRPPLRPGGTVEMYHHPTMWACREHPTVYDAFRDLLGEERLWVSVDRVRVSLPVRPDRPGWGQGSGLHMDLNPGARMLPDRLKGMLFLTDCDERQGGFACVPGVYRQLKRTLHRERRAGLRPQPEIDLSALATHTARAGDLLLWDSAAPHADMPNHGERPRMVQFIAMQPAVADDHGECDERINHWLGQVPSQYDGVGSLCWEEQYGGPAALSKLGRRLIGLDPWEAPIAA